MKQYLLQSEPQAGEIEVSGKDFHYLIRVRRLKPGATIPGLSPQDNRYTLTLEKIGPDSCLFSAVLDSKLEEPSSIPSITLYQGLPKGSKMDSIVRKAVECGVSQIIPLNTRYCVSKLEGKAIESKTLRWKRIAKEAAQQSGTLLAPQIGFPRDLSGVPAVQNKQSECIVLFFHQELLENSSLHEYLSDQFANIALIIGPEGGFAQDELDLMLEKGFRPVYLGKRILRTETAGIFALGAVQTILLERGTWEPVA